MPKVKAHELSKMQHKMPIRYYAEILTPGQCRDNFKIWRGMWMLGLSRQPRDSESSDGGLDATGEKCFAVLCRRLSVSDVTETRYFGTAEKEFLAGDCYVLTVDWEWTATNVRHGNVDLGEIENLQRQPVSDEYFLQHDFLIRDAYLMLGSTGDAVYSPDDCIRLNVVNGFKCIE